MISIRESRWFLAAASTLLFVVAAPGSAEASTVHTPSAGAAVQQGQALLFDWRWTDGEYATGSIVFTQAGDASNPTWLGGQRPDRIAVTDDGYPFLESNATVRFTDPRFTPGQWYWRLCNKTIDGEDDKCYYDGSAPVPLTITPAPPPPAAAPTPPTGSPDAEEPLTPAANPVPAPSRAAAKKAALRVISQRLGLGSRARARRVSCTKAPVGLRRSCTVAFVSGKNRYRGTVGVSYRRTTDGALSARYKADLRRSGPAGAKRIRRSGAI